MIKKIKSFFRTFPLTRKLYVKLYNMKHKKEFEAKRKALQENGIKLIHFLQDTMSEYEFFFDMGTLLGIIREGKLLGHDLDVDMAVLPRDEGERDRIIKTLQDAGCELKSSYETEGIGIVEDSFVIDGIKFDVNYYRQEEKDYCYLMYQGNDKEYAEGEMSVVRLECSHIEMIVKTEFSGKEINVPQNPENYLAERYGKNWRIPDKNYVYWCGPSATQIDNKGKQITYNK